MEKVGLKIVELLHSITQLDYKVSFNSDFEGMIRIDYTEEYNTSFYEHSHLGFPGCERIDLEKAIIKDLNNFYNKVVNEKT